jgi:hypothetical protein
MRSVPSATRRNEVLLALASAALVPGLLLVAEAALRVTPLRSPRPLSWDDMTGVYRHSEVYGWEPRPRFAAEIEGARVTINRLGYRGREHAFEKTSRRTRVVLLGDSLTFGFRTGDEATFASLLDADALEVVNLGVEGYGTDQELIKLEREGVRYHPDVVVLNVCVDNDLVDNWTSENLFHLGYPRPYFRVENGQLVHHDELVRLSAAGRLAVFLREHSLLYRWVAERSGATQGLLRSDWRRLARQAMRDPAPLLDLAYRLIRRMDAVSRDAGARLVVLLHPNRRAFEGREPMLEAILRAPELAGIRVVSLRREYLRARESSDLLLDDSGHLNGEGHRAAAAAIRRVLKNLN